MLSLVIKIHSKLFTHNFTPMIKWILSFSNLLLFFTFLNAQCISGDCQNGKGTYLYPSGAKYVGEFQNGEIHGVGVCYYTDGTKYSGQWSRRFPEGKGTKTFPDGTKIFGNWSKGQPLDDDGNVIEELVAKGDKNSDDGTNIQTGCISGDCKNGSGIFAYADGSKYDGNFHDGELNGLGTWYFPNGDKYVGNFRDNYSHGNGTLYYADGSEMVGEWVEGEYKGDVQMTAKEGEGCIAGNCKNGKGTYVYEGAEAKYVGDFKNNLADGEGVCYYANGERYEGQWSNGSFNGIGTLFLQDGTQVHGAWDFGTFMGPQNEPVANEPEPEVANEIIDDISSEVTVKEALDMKVWAVVIGVASYSHMPVLRYTDDDAYRMFAFLKSPEGGALSDDQIRILIDEEATKENITTTMKDVFSKAGPKDLVMLYFSGHGLKGSFLPIDFDGYNNKIYHEEINEILESSPAKYKLCIADACHSGSLFAMKGNVENALSNYYKSLAQAQPGTALIMSSKSDETSLESSGLRQGVFSHFLIRGLKGEADTNGNRIVSVEELYNFIGENVRTYTGMRQSPVMKGDFDGKMTVAVIR